MQRVALWEINGLTPTRLSASPLDLERHLEEWIELDPALLQSGLDIIGRQVVLDAGRLDLLAIDPQGRICAIEIKRESLTRDTIAQALDYAACLSTVEAADLRAKAVAYLEPRGQDLASLLSKRQVPSALELNERQIQMFVVGIGVTADLQRVTGFLSQYEVPITVVSYDAFVSVDGRRILCREVSDVVEAPIRKEGERAAVTLGDLQKQADTNGIGDGFRALVAAAEATGLYPVPYKWSVRFAPAARKSRALFTIWSIPSKEGLLQAWVGGSVFTEFYPVSVDQVTQAVGTEG
jgi:Holliday junction resolvase-like predicted endonuclease